MTGIGKKIIYVLLALAVIVAAYLLISNWSKFAREEPSQGVQEVPGETRSVTVFFASREADGMLSEAREIAVREGLEEQVKGVLMALFQGPESSDMVSAIPNGTEILQVFWMEESQTLFLDFNRALISNHPGGSVGEYYTISMILKTVAANFPQVRKLQFLVDGYPVETIAGHYSVSKPLEIMRWR